MLTEGKAKGFLSNNVNVREIQEISFKHTQKQKFKGTLCKVEQTIRQTKVLRITLSPKNKFSHYPEPPAPNFKATFSKLHKIILPWFSKLDEKPSPSKIKHGRVVDQAHKQNTQPPPSPHTTPENVN